MSRALTVLCSSCGWTVSLPRAGEHYDISPASAWDIDPGVGATCDRCSQGWKPRNTALEGRVASLIEAGQQLADKMLHGRTCPFPHGCVCNDQQKALAVWKAVVNQ